MTRTEIAEYLFTKANEMIHYPDQLTKTDKMVISTAFFPVGYGLWDEPEYKETPDILILGQDFGTEQQYLDILSNRKSDLQTPTWKSLQKILDSSEIPLKRCFFSNALMGLRTSNVNTGSSPGLKNKEYLAQNIQFLKLQIETIKPCLIIVLGSVSPTIIEKVSFTSMGWDHFKFKEYTDIEKSLAFLDLGQSVPIPCIPILHPSMSFRYLMTKRLYQGQEGFNAETSFLHALYNKYCHDNKTL